jgi:hypothetical protein
VTEAAAVTSVMLPAYATPCLRCLRTIVTACDCDPVKADRARTNTHASTCRPTYRAEGGALPNRCPSCTSPKWLEAPAWRHGAGTSAETLRRRKVARAAARANEGEARENKGKRG